MTPSVNQVYDTVRQILGDLYVATGEIFTNDILAGPFGLAFRELFSELDNNGVHDILHVVYASLPAYITQFDPLANGISNFRELYTLRQRINVTDSSVASVAPVGGIGSALQITTTTAHNLSVGQEVQTFGIVGVDGSDIGGNGRWFADINSPTVLTLRGSLWTGIAAAPALGTVVTGQDIWIPMIYVREFQQITPNQTLDYYRKIGSRIYFIGSTIEHELEISFYGSGDAPLTGSTGVDDSLNYLANRTAYWAATGRPAYASHVPMLMAASQAYLAQLIQTTVVYGQAPARPRPFRPYRPRRFYRQF